MENELMINAIMRYDNIKILATIRAKNDIFTIHEEEVNLKNKKREEVKTILKNIFSQIENKSSQKVKMINLIFDDFMKKSEHLKFKEKILEESFEFKNGRTLINDDWNQILNNMILSAKTREKNYQLISVIPFRFQYWENGLMDEFESNSFPLNKKLDKIKIIFSVRYMDMENYKKSIEYFDTLDLKIESVTLETQLSIYESMKQADLQNNRMDFILSIQDNKTILISSVNDIVIKTDSLKISFNNLIKKISDDFQISYQEARSLILCYNKLSINEDNDLNEIIYSSYSFSSENFKPITKNDINDTIKSFLKSICMQANEIINSRINNSSRINDLKIVGELSNMSNVLNYCTKYFDKIKVSQVELQNESIYNWNKNFSIAKKYCQYLELLNNKMKPESFYYNNNDIGINKNYQEENIFEKRIKPEIALA